MRTKGLSGFTLCIIAMVTMLLDHSYIALFRGANYLNYIGRVSFPIFAYLLVEGYYNTGSRIKYALRLFIFALISEIPFNLLIAQSINFKEHQNVMFELLFGIIVLSANTSLIEGISSGRLFKVVMGALVMLLSFTTSYIYSFDYSCYGLALIILFAISRDFKYSKLIQLIGMVGIFIVWYIGIGWTLNIGNFCIYLPRQSLCILSLPLIWLYNGERGYASNHFKYMKYSFYPLHLIILYILREVFIV